MQLIDRRHALKLSAFTFVTAAVAASIPRAVDARMWRADVDRNLYPVSPKHTAEIDAGFGPSWPKLKDSERIRIALATLSNERHLTKSELLTVRAADHILNMNTSIKLLKGRDFRTMFTYIDQVHVNGYPMPCGCMLVCLFDHHTRGNPSETVHYPHYPHWICDDHFRLSNDWEEHFRTVINENSVPVA